MKTSSFRLRFRPGCKVKSFAAGHRLFRDISFVRFVLSFSPNVLSADVFEQSLQLVDLFTGFCFDAQ